MIEDNVKIPCVCEDRLKLGERMKQLQIELIVGTSAFRIFLKFAGTFQNYRPWKHNARETIPVVKIEGTG